MDGKLIKSWKYRENPVFEKIGYLDDDIPEFGILPNI